MRPLLITYARFVFSVPVTWRTNLGLLAKIEDTIRAAGFGRRGDDTALVYMTEAEAAAIFASKQSMTKGEVFLVVDAGAYVVSEWRL